MSPKLAILLTLGLCGLVLGGCDHPTAASPIASSATDASAPDITDEISQTAPVTEQSDHAPAEEANGHATSPEPPPASPTVPPTAGQRPPADRTPSRPGEAEKITFEDLNLGMPADIVFREFMISDRVKELEGKRISIVGYMHGGQSTQRGIKDFILLKNTQCKFGPGGQADHLANIILKEGASTAFTPSPVKVEGTLKVEPYQGTDGNTWSIYRLENSQIK